MSSRKKRNTMQESNDSLNNTHRSNRKSKKDQTIPNFEQSSRNFQSNGQPMPPFSEDPNNYQEGIPFTRPRNLSIKWLNVMKIDLDTIKGSKDMGLLEEFLENFLFSKITEDEIQSVPEGNVAKLIKILQFTSENLLNTQQNLEDQINFLEQDKNRLINDCQRKDDLLMREKELIDKLRNDRKNNKEQIATYKSTIDYLIKGGLLPNNKTINTKITDINVDVNKMNENYKFNGKNINNGGGACRCPYCTAKIFATEYELNRHLTDIHLIQPQPSRQEPQALRVPVIQQQQSQGPIIIPIQNNNANFENQLNEMKNKIDTFVQNRNAQTFMMEPSNNNNNEMLRQDLEKMGFTVNQGFKQLLDIVLINQQKNNQNNGPISIKIPAPPRQNEPEPEADNSQFDIELSKLKEEVKLYGEQQKTEKEQYESKKQSLEIENQKLKESLRKRVPYKPGGGIKNSIIDNPSQTLNIIAGEDNKDKKSDAIGINEGLNEGVPFHAGPLESDYDSDDGKDDKEDKLKEIKRQIMELSVASEIFLEFTKKNTRFTSSKKPQPQPQPQSKPVIINMDHFYRDYKDRDRKYLTDPKFVNFIGSQILPNEFDENRNIKRISRENIKDKVFGTSKIFFKPGESKLDPTAEVDELAQEDKNDLCDLIEDTAKDINLINAVQGEKEMQYNSILKALGFDEIKNNVNLIKNSKKY